MASDPKLPQGAPEPDYGDLEYEQDGWDDDEDEVECGLMPDGQCRFAGSEHCDWTCRALDDEEPADG